MARLMSLAGCIAMALAAVSCPGGTTPSGSYNYPAGWPISSLAIPSGSKQLIGTTVEERSALRGNETEVARFGTMEGTRYNVWYTNNDGWEKNLAAFQQGLAASGKNFAKRDEYSGAAYGMINADRKYIVHLNFHAPSKTYKLKISEYAQGIPAGL